MSGHSHWAGIKHKKALVDAKRGKLWSKLAKAIIVAAKMGGGDPRANLRLRRSVERHLCWLIDPWRPHPDSLLGTQS